MKKNRAILCVGIILLILFSSCGRVPQAELDQAKALMDSISKAEAELYAPIDFDDFETAYNKALDEIEKQSAKSLATYKEAKQLLLVAIDLGSELAEKNLAKKAELRLKVDNTYKRASELNEENEILIPKIGGSTVIIEYQNNIERVVEDLGKVADIIDNDGNLIKALELAELAEKKANDVYEDLLELTAGKSNIIPEISGTPTLQHKPAKKKK